MMSRIAEFVAVLSCSLFAGAAIYISLAQLSVRCCIRFLYPIAPLSRYLDSCMRPSLSMVPRCRKERKHDMRVGWRIQQSFETSKVQILRQPILTPTSQPSGRELGPSGVAQEMKRDSELIRLFLTGYGELGG